MATVTKIEELTFALPDSERATIAAHLLRSLPAVLVDEDEGVAGALRREAQLTENPEIGLSLEQLDRRVKSRRL